MFVTTFHLYYRLSIDEQILSFKGFETAAGRWLLIAVRDPKKMGACADPDRNDADVRHPNPEAFAIGHSRHVFRVRLVRPEASEVAGSHEISDNPSTHRCTTHPDHLGDMPEETRAAPAAGLRGRHARIPLQEL